MSEAPEAPVLERAATRRATLGDRRRRLTATLAVVPELDRGSANVSAISGSGHRIWPQKGFVAELSCECGRPNCRATLPRDAELHRGLARTGCVIVAPEHYLGLGTVQRAADRFFVVAVE
jgi:hypothetical protein